MVVVQKKLNLTRTVRKLPIDENMERAGHYIHDDRQLEVKYDDADWVIIHSTTSPFLGIWHAILQLGNYHCHPVH